MTPLDSSQSLEAKLLPCINCITKLDYNNYRYAHYSRKHEIIHSFSLKDFFAENETIFKSLPRQSANTSSNGDYVDNWPEISRAYRQSKNWKCECCQVDLNQNRHLLHSHHIDHNKKHNANRNLKALCITCHKAQPHHDNLQIDPLQKRDITTLRKTQELPISCDQCPTPS